METWEYAVGQEGLDGTWETDTEPTPHYEAAQRAFARLLIEHRNDEWLIDPQILKRSERHPVWTPVLDHAAELLAEVLEDLRLDFATHGAGIMQGVDLAKVFRKRARLINPDKSVEEYDS